MKKVIDGGSFLICSNEMFTSRKTERLIMLRKTFDDIIQIAFDAYPNCWETFYCLQRHCLNFSQNTIKIKVG